MSYLRDPAEIERRSFEQIRRLTDLSGLDDVQQQVAMRMVHTSGEPELAGAIRFTGQATRSGLDALHTGATVLCDTEMVVHGIARRFLDGPIRCFLNAPSVAERARRRNVTRSMAALDLWLPHLDGAIVVIGNAPTALFRLLEMLGDDASRPALIIGMPVGFIGAEESKQALWEACEADPRLQAITLTGRRGGSALAASALNALARYRRGIRY